MVCARQVWRLHGANPDGCKVQLRVLFEISPKSIGSGFFSGRGLLGATMGGNHLGLLARTSKAASAAVF